MSPKEQAVIDAAYRFRVADVAYSRLATKAGPVNTWSAATRAAMAPTGAERFRAHTALKKAIQKLPIGEARKRAKEGGAS